MERKGTSQGKRPAEQGMEILAQPRDGAAEIVVSEEAARQLPSSNDTPDNQSPENSQTVKQCADAGLVALKIRLSTIGIVLAIFVVAIFGLLFFASFEREGSATGLKIGVAALFSNIAEPDLVYAYMVNDVGRVNLPEYRSAIEFVERNKNSKVASMTKMMLLSHLSYDFDRDWLLPPPHCTTNMEFESLNKRVMSLYPNEPAVRLYSARTAVIGLDYSTAANELRNFIEESQPEKPYSYTATKILQAVLCAQGEWDQLLKNCSNKGAYRHGHFNELALLHTKQFSKLSASTQEQLWLGRASLYQGDELAALSKARHLKRVEACKQALRSSWMGNYPQQQEREMLESDIALKRGDYRSALTHASKVPLTSSICRQMALLTKLGRYQECLKLANDNMPEKKIAAAPFVYAAKAECHFHNGDVELAQECVRKALSINPRFIRALETARLIALNEGKQDQARHFQEQIKAAGAQIIPDDLCYEVED